MIRICLFGAGRIGAIHAANAAAHAGVELRYVVDVNAAAAQSLAQKYGARCVEPEVALEDPGLDAVIIASSTGSHAKLIMAAAERGLAIFCEKPIDLERRRTRECLDVIRDRKVPFLLGFNRRFDRNFRALHVALMAGSVGSVEMVHITSRDPGPPPAEYLKGSGGMFKDMSIHDFDMARWLLGEEPVRVYASASCLVDPAIAAAGDIDSAMVVMHTASGRICGISNSRRAAYGYDQRVEVLGSAGMLRAENELESTLQTYTGTGIRHDRLNHFFLDRYAGAYRRELQEFVECVTTGRTPEVGGDDGYRALLLAEAALESVRSGAPVSVDNPPA